MSYMQKCLVGNSREKEIKGVGLWEDGIIKFEKYEEKTVVIESKNPCR